MKRNLFKNYVFYILYQVFTLYFEKLKEINEIVKTGDEQKIISISKDTSMYIQNGMSPTSKKIYAGLTI